MNYQLRKFCNTERRPCQLCPPSVIRFWKKETMIFHNFISFVFAFFSSYMGLIEAIFEELSSLLQRLPKNNGPKGSAILRKEFHKRRGNHRWVRSHKRRKSSRSGKFSVFYRRPQTLPKESPHLATIFLISEAFGGSASI
jgi:hypothetical protein